MLTSAGRGQGSYFLMWFGAITHPLSVGSTCGGVITLCTILNRVFHQEFLLMIVTYFRSHNISGWISGSLAGVAHSNWN
jgi:hypothetical protein